MQCLLGNSVVGVVHRELWQVFLHIIVLMVGLGLLVVSMDQEIMLVDVSCECSDGYVFGEVAPVTTSAKTVNLLLAAMPLAINSSTSLLKHDVLRH